MSTADTARDLDLVRQAVGDERLTYYGVSYGTQLAATYVAMFPDRVRAVIADGVLDPVAWTTGDGDGTTRPFSTRLGSGYGAWNALTNAFAECDRVGPRRCPIAGRASEVWLDIVSRLRKRPFHFDGGGRVRYQDVVAGALGPLYDQASVRSLMQNLADLHRAMFGRGDRPFVHPRAWARTDGGDDRVLPGPYSPAWARAPRLRTGDPFAGVACADSTNPERPRAWVRAGRRADHASPWFGRLWTWASSRCAGWPAATQEDRFTGPWAVTTSAPVLVVGNSYDPATPIHGARALQRLLDGSRLLILDAWGHGALGSGPCITEAYGAYLLEGTLPPAGTVCEPGRQLFPARG
jgi:pimeloyl-ACP methyl ester carboxylesterase